MSVVNSQLDTGSVGDKIVRTADGAYLVLQGTNNGVPALMDATDDAWLLPHGSRIKVTGTSPTQYFSADIRYSPLTDEANPHNWSITTTAAIGTPIQTFLAGLDTFDDLLSTPQVTG